MPRYSDKSMTATEVAGRTEEQVRQDWREALACPAARRIFGRMIHLAAFSRSHCPGDTHGTAYNEGIRAAGLEVMAAIEMVKPGETAVLLTATLQEINHADQAI